MTRINIILTRDLNELKARKAFKWLLVFFILIAIITMLLLSSIFFFLDRIEVEVTKEMIATMLGNTICFFSIIPFITFIWIFTPAIMTKEKSNGNLETLLATPLTLFELWVGKGLAVFLPGFLISTGTTLLFIGGVNLASFITEYKEGVIFPLAALLTSIISNPLLFLSLCFCIIILSFIKNTDVAILPSFLIGFGLLIGLPLGIALNVIDLISWSFTFYYFLSIILFCILIFLISLTLTKEKVVLASKQE
jgi:hypothetical protein